MTHHPIRMRQTFKVLLVGIFLMATACDSQAQSFFDVSSCFNNLLQQKIDYTATTKLSLATLSQVSESTYETFKHDGKLSAEYDFVPISANYSDFSTKRRQYFELHKLDLDYYRAISTSSRLLGDAGYKVISECVQQLASKADGFHYLYSVDDENAASVMFFWRPSMNIRGGDLVHVTDSTLDNAVVVNGDSYKGHLYDIRFYTRDPRIGVASAPILLKRIDASKVIRISLSTDPSVNVGFITIPPVPKPLPQPVFKVHYENTDYPIPFKKKSGTHLTGANPLCGDCSNWEKVWDAPGQVISVKCVFGPGSHINTSYCGAQGETQAKWTYFSNDGNDQDLTMTVTYKKKIEECVSNCPSSQ